ncbi:hypothetical protein MKX01_035360 [Papaver californicum]|nr:hypothetical protein MKX01_035360 [Papaver californicum]
MQAIREGADAMVAVGGDGTLHEVISLGTGSDFARTFGWKNDKHEAVQRISKGISPFIFSVIMLLQSSEAFLW